MTVSRFLKGQISAKAPYSWQTATMNSPYVSRAINCQGANSEFVKLVGGTVAWGQSVSNGNFSDGTTGWTKDASSASWAVSNNVLTVTATTNSGAAVAHSAFSILANHVYWYAFDYNTSSGATNNFRWMYTSNSLSGAFSDSPTSGAWASVNKFIKLDTDAGNRGIRVGYTSSAPLPAGESYSIRNVRVFDLTAMFGVAIADYAYSLEQQSAGSGIAWLKSYGFFLDDYYPFSNAKLESVQTSAHVVTGFNQWDEEWEKGTINTTTGQNASSNNTIRSTNYIPALPSSEYFFEIGETANVNVLFYDADNNYIGRYNNTYFSAPNTFTTTATTSYIRFYVATTYGASYKNDICINLSNPSLNGTYEPYTSTTYPTSSVILRGIWELENGQIVCKKGDTYEADGTVNRRFAEVDLGTLTWTYEITANYNAFRTQLPLKVPGSASMLCDKYPTVISRNIFATQDDAIAPWNATESLYIAVRDDSYTDAATFKTAMSGHYLVYELATPTTESADPYTNPIAIDPNGSESWTDAGTRDFDMPVGNETSYAGLYPDLGLTNLGITAQLSLVNPFA